VAKQKATKPQGQQLAFVEEFIVDHNGTAAAIRAGYSPGGASRTATRLLTYPYILEGIIERMDARSERTGITADMVLQRVWLLANFNIGKFLRTNDEGVAVYDFSEATEEDWYCIQEYTVDQIGRGQDVIPADRLKIKTYDKLRALELAGRHVDVQAWKDRIDFAGRVMVEKVERVIVTTAD